MARQCARRARAGGRGGRGGRRQRGRRHCACRRRHVHRPRRGHAARPGRRGGAVGGGGYVRPCVAHADGGPAQPLVSGRRGVAYCGVAARAVRRLRGRSGQNSRAAELVVALGRAGGRDRGVPRAAAVRCGGKFSAPKRADAARFTSGQPGKRRGSRPGGPWRWRPGTAPTQHAARSDRCAAEGRRSGRSGEKEMTGNRRGSTAVVHQCGTTVERQSDGATKMTVNPGRC